MRTAATEEEFPSLSNSPAYPVPLQVTRYSRPARAARLAPGED